MHTKVYINNQVVTLNEDEDNRILYFELPEGLLDI
jgi:hypothetical protein